MGYKSTLECILDLDKSGQLLRIKEEVDPYLEMAEIHRQIFAEGGPAILFENIKGTRYQAVSNLFGTLERSRYIFRDSIEDIKKTIYLKNHPEEVMKKPLKYYKQLFTFKNALPKKARFTDFEEISISELPLVHSWPKDGGAFVTLPQVYSEDVNKKGPLNGNMGMYRIQLTGNAYVLNKEIGLHYQLHRGIGVHHTVAKAEGKPLKVSIFVGGTPASTLGAVMPLPEGISELTFSGALAKRRFRYAYKEGYLISLDADFVITGEVDMDGVKEEGPFGDHLGYYSLAHDFPYLKVDKVYAKKDAIWPFTVVGRPPQEDSQFGALIHEITGNAIQHEINGLEEVNAVDDAGVHPLLLAIGRERYTPFNDPGRPQELHTIAHQLMGYGQLSLAKYLFITSRGDTIISTKDERVYFTYILERIDFKSDFHFYTKTIIDTLDYSGEGLNKGSKVAVVVGPKKRRDLCKEIPLVLQKMEGYVWGFVSEGIVAVSSKENTLNTFIEVMNETQTEGVGMFVWCDDAKFVSASFSNFLWVTFTRSNPSHDVYGIREFILNKHWGCEGPFVIDATIKKHHSPQLEIAPEISEKCRQIIRQAKSSGN